MAWHGIWYDLAGMVRYTVWPGGDGMVYVMAWRGMVYGYVLAGMTWYMVWPSGMAWYVVWPDGHDMVYGMAWWAWHGKRYGLVGTA